MVLRRRVGPLWLSARIIETEAYYLQDKGSHASLGCTLKRRALFMAAGTLYMYYARGGDSLNISVAGAGNAVLIKAGYPWLDALSNPASLAYMQKLNPAATGGCRLPQRLCAGQTLLCRALALKVPEWDGRRFDATCFFIDDIGTSPAQLIRTTRLGIPSGRDEHLPYRYVDPEYAPFCTRNPLRRGQVMGQDYVWVPQQEGPESYAECFSYHPSVRGNR
jgi:DNA-3-methyladenine glycosylase